MSGARARSEALPHGFVKADAGCDGDVEAGHLAFHGNANEKVAALAGEAAHPGSLGSHHQSDRAAQIGFVEQAVSSVIGSDKPATGFLEAVHGANQVAHGDDGGVPGGSARDAHDGFRDRRGVMFRREHGENAGGIRGTQAGAEVVGIRDAVEEEDERVGFRFEFLEEPVFIPSGDVGRGCRCGVPIGSG